MPDAHQGPEPAPLVDMFQTRSGPVVVTIRSGMTLTALHLGILADAAHQGGGYAPDTTDRTVGPRLVELQRDGLMDGTLITRHGRIALSLSGWRSR